VACLLPLTGCLTTQTVSTESVPAETGSTQTVSAQTLPQPAGPSPGPPQDNHPAYCKPEFAKLREETENLGLVTQVAAQTHAPRNEVCKDTTVYLSSLAKWIKYSETNEEACGIPAANIAKLKEVYANTVKTRQKVCNAVLPAGRQ
jgi:hypothetical protein